ncbi:MAG: glycosyltransferase family 2 protein [Deltaproteobacteria bacterium]|nr:glycosyltransferase family 2 protein [Deltaproteobacteria bacterium]
MKAPVYHIITPAHNEAEYLPRVMAGVAAQTLKPAKWVIVDDRSTDDTWRQINAAAQRYSFIEPVQVQGGTERALGSNVVQVFNVGFARTGAGGAFVVKMDADVLLPPDYFAKLLARFQEEPRLGIASGKTYIPHQGRWVLERTPDFHASGPCKTYRLTCFREIGGLIPILGWDILDEAPARRYGWQTRGFRDLPLYHLRMMGSATGMARANLRYGRCYYGLRAHPLFVLAKALYRALEQPYLASLLIPVGYLLAAWHRGKRLDDPGLAEFLRREQLDRLRGRTLGQEEWWPRKLDPGQ